MNEERCQMCGEMIAVDEMGLAINTEVGEFWIGDGSLWGHASCGLEREYPVA